MLDPAHQLRIAGVLQRLLGDEGETDPLPKFNQERRKIAARLHRQTRLPQDGAGDAGVAPVGCKDQHPLGHRGGGRR